jgi:uncharacterized membrane-anchored protein
MILLMRWVTTLFLIGLASCVGVWLSNNPGEVQLDWMGYRLSTHIWVVVVSLAMVTVIGGTVFAFLMRSLRIFSGWGTRRSIKQHQRGLDALTHTVAALSLSDYASAQAHLSKSCALLGEALPLNTLLQAHISSRTGNVKAAQKALEAMQAWPETRFVALSRLSSMAQAEGNETDALRYAKEAYVLRPKHLPAAWHYLGLLVTVHAFAEAHALIKVLRAQRVIGKERVKHLSSRVHMAHALSDVKSPHYSALLSEAFAADPSFRIETARQRASCLETASAIMEDAAASRAD